jgi:thiamine-phosphate pyrophosphorylase
MIGEFARFLAGGEQPGFIHPDFVGDISRSRRPEAGVYRGVDSAIGLFVSMREAIDDLRWTGRVVERPEADIVLLETSLSGRGRTSGIAIPGRGAMIWELRGDQLAGTILFQSLDEARDHLERRRRAARLARASLYFVCEARPHARDPRPLLDAAIRGGAEIIQLRDKELGDEDLIAAARPFREAADAGGALFLLNDRPDLVRDTRADGVHVGQDDLSVAEARRIAGEAALVGLSTHTPEQVERASAAGGVERSDQISVGPVWETPTKAGRPATGIGLIEFAARAATVPWFAIGGIDAETAATVARAGATRAVVVRAIRDADDPEAAARAIATALAAPARQTDEH